MAEFCPFCNLLVRDAIQTYRGERACKSCYRNAKGSGNVCPIDQQPIEDGEIFNDRYARREISRLKCYCSSKKNGCSWEGVIKDLKVHEPTCSLKPMDCPYQCGEDILLDDLYDHVQNCPKLISGSMCPYQIVGCKHEPRNSADLVDHPQIASYEHAALAVSLVTSLHQRNEKMKQDLLTEQNLRAELERILEAQENDTDMLATKLKTKKLQGQVYDTGKDTALDSAPCLRFDMATSQSEDVNTYAGGYPVTLSLPLPSKYTCTFCKLLMRDTIQTYRGERACESCYLQAKGNSKCCPIDNEPIGDTEAYPDNGARREIEQLMCYCTNKHIGCKWKGKLIHLEIHEAQCKYGSIVCNDCSNTFLRKDEEDHVKNRCHWMKPTSSMDLDCHINKDMKIHAAIAVANINNLKADNQTKVAQATDGMLKDITDLEPRFNSRKPGALNGTSDSEEVIDRMERASAITSANLSDLELKLQLLENTTYDGKLLWKVDNVCYRMNQAETGEVTSLHSAPCFQKRGGYKFCSRLYLNGGGMGLGSHVSLFFVIMKSEYDALLQWPFAERVTFRLINPHNVTESIMDSFIPDRNSSNWNRPQNDMNIAAGCPLFIRKEDIVNFIIDDAIYIETSISPA